MAKYLIALAFALGLCTQAYAAYAPMRITVNPVKDFHCVGNGIADDTACFRLALANSQGNALELGPYKYLINGTLTPTGPVHVFGVGAGQNSTPLAAQDSSSEIIEGSAGATLWSLSGATTGSSFEKFKATFTSGGKAFVQSGAAWSSRFIDLWVHNPCEGFKINGHQNYVVQDLVDGITGASCHALTLGDDTTLSGSVGNYIESNWFIGINGDTTATMMVVYDSGGSYFFDNNTLYGKTGLEIIPGLNQQVIWTWWANNVISDSTTGPGLVIDTADATAQIKGNDFRGDWVASTNSQAGTFDGIQIKNTAGGLVTGNLFRDFQLYAITGNAVSVVAGVDSSFNNLDVCGFNGYGVSVSSGVTGTKIWNSHFSPSCVAQSGWTGTTGINLAGTNASTTIIGNDLLAMTTTIAGVPTGRSIIESNLGLEDTTSTLATGATVALTTVAPIYILTGTTTVNTISGGWGGRKLRIITSDGAVLFTGGNMCNNLTSSQGVFVEAEFVSTCWYLK